MLPIDPKYVYLIGILVITVVYLTALFFRKDLRKIALFTSFFIASSSTISEILFFRDYWYPPSFFELNILGIRILIEDFLFAFSAISGAFLYLFIFNKKLDREPTDYKIYIARFLRIGIPYVVLFFAITLIFGVNSIFSSMISAIILCIFILYTRRDLIKVFFLESMLSGTVAFIFYFLAVVIVGNKYLREVWLLDHTRYGLPLFGIIIPLTEIAFAATVFPAILLFILFASQSKIISNNKN